MGTTLRQLAGSMALFGQYVKQHRWDFVRAVFVAALVWYALMNVLRLMVWDGFAMDPMPVIAGVPILVCVWRAIDLRAQLIEIVNDFDDGAAFVFAPGNPRSKADFINDFRKVINRNSRLWGGGLAAFLFVAAILVVSTFPQDENTVVQLINDAILIVGLPLIGVPLGILAGSLLGYGRLTSVMKRHGVTLAGISTPRARDALRGLENIYSFALITFGIMSFWIAGWWILWTLGGDLGEYRVLWQYNFQILWATAIFLFILAGALPAFRFRRLVAQLDGGLDARRAVAEQIAEAEIDLVALKANNFDASRQGRERVEELDAFIANLKDQRIDSRLLHPAPHFSVVGLSLAIWAGPAVWSGLQWLHLGG